MNLFHSYSQVERTDFLKHQGFLRTTVCSEAAQILLIGAQWCQVILQKQASKSEKSSQEWANYRKNKLKMRFTLNWDIKSSKTYKKNKQHATHKTCNKHAPKQPTRKNTRNLNSREYYKVGNTCGDAVAQYYQ